MNQNENKNATDHSANLEMFFSRKMEIDRINRKIKRNEKVSKKKRENQLSFNYDKKKQFRLVDSNYVAAVSVKRMRNGIQRPHGKIQVYNKQKTRKVFLKKI